MDRTKGSRPRPLANHWIRTLFPLPCTICRQETTVLWVGPEVGYSICQSCRVQELASLDARESAAYLKANPDPPGGPEE